MDTSKIKTNIIVPTDEQIVKEEKKVKRRLIWNYIWKIALLVLTVIVMIRVPYAGTYIDGLIDYVFGMSKYVLYLLFLFILISVIFHFPSEKVIKTRRFVVIVSIGMLFISCLISGVMDTIVYWKTTPSFVDIMKHYHSEWKDYFFKNSYTNFANIGYVSGGIVAVLVAYLFNRVSYIVLIVTAAVGIALCTFSIFNINYRTTKIGLKIRKWMIKKLGGTFNYDGFNELKDIKDNQNKFKKTSKSDIVQCAKTSDNLPFELLPQSDVTCFNENFKKAGNVQDKIREFFKKHGIDATPSELNVYSTYNELCFDAKDDRTINEIIEVGEELAQAVKLDNYNLTIRGHVITFEIPVSYFSKISLRSALMLLDDKPNDMTAVFGLDKKSHPYLQDFRILPSAIILGKKGSGSATLAVLMALSMCYITSPENLELKVLSANSEVTYNVFAKLPHTNGIIANDIASCVKQLNEIHNLVNTRMGLIKSIDAYNLDQYNAAAKNPNDKLKHVLVLMSNFENIIRESFQNNKVVNEILVNGPKVGVHTILQSYHVGIEAMDECIYNACSQKYILKLETDSESQMIFENERGCQLHTNGDCLTFTKSVRDMIRIQICNINQLELAQDIDIIKTFYEVKDETNQKQEQTDAASNPTTPISDEPAVEEKKETEEVKQDDKTDTSNNDEDQISDKQLEHENNPEILSDALIIQPTFESPEEESKTIELKSENESQPAPEENSSDSFMIQPQFDTSEVKDENEPDGTIKSEPAVEENKEESLFNDNVIQPQFDNSDAKEENEPVEEAKPEPAVEENNNVVQKVESASVPEPEELKEEQFIDETKSEPIVEENEEESLPNDNVIQPQFDTSEVKDENEPVEEVEPEPIVEENEEESLPNDNVIQPQFDTSEVKDENEPDEEAKPEPAVEENNNVVQKVESASVPEPEELKEEQFIDETKSEPIVEENEEESLPNDNVAQPRFDTSEVKDENEPVEEIKSEPAVEENKEEPSMYDDGVQQQIEPASVLESEKIDEVQPDSNEAEQAPIEQANVQEDSSKLESTFSPFAFEPEEPKKEIDKNEQER